MGGDLDKPEDEIPIPAGQATPLTNDVLYKVDTKDMSKDKIPLSKSQRTPSDYDLNMERTSNPQTDMINESDDLYDEIANDKYGQGAQDNIGLNDSLMDMNMASYDEEQDPPLDSTEAITDAINSDTISTRTPLDPTDTGQDNTGNNLSTAGEMEPDHVHEVQMDPPQSDKCHDSVPLENPRISTPTLFATRDEQSFESSSSSSNMQNHPSEPTMESLLIQQLRTQIQQLQQDVAAKESQQIKTMLELHNKEKDLLVSQIRDTKEEAKERVAKMQQHVERLEAEVAATSSSSQDSSSQKEDFIQAQRSEGEALAIKISEVEQTAKDTRRQLLDVQDELTTQLKKKVVQDELITQLERKVHDLETELKSIRAKWTMAQQKEVRADQLETSLLKIREEGEIKSAQIVSLKTEVKEYKSQITMLEKLNVKVQTLEQEATVREDALRKEVGELRKQRQDAVQRAHGKMYMFIQQMTRSEKMSYSL
jgi:hypothetical protein